jgi:hypothetical protein
MIQTANSRNVVVIELINGVLVKTAIPPVNHSALRSGFAGYPANPRWSATKIVAWKTGRQWREALARGEMVVRQSDSMLLKVQDHPPKVPIKLGGAFCLLWDVFKK